jgi:murein L,D-transpeptidase YafK
MAFWRLACIFDCKMRFSPGSLVSRRMFLRLTLASTVFNPKASVAMDAPLPIPLVNPRIVVAKRKRLLTLYSDDKVVRSYRVALGLSPVEDKIRAGDRRTPEGDFYVCIKNPRSKYYLSLGLSYPNQQHAERGLRDGLITRAQYNQISSAIKSKRQPPQYTRLGGEIFIHGNGSQHDWTWGCVALEDNDIRELYDAVPVGTPVHIEH